MLVKAILGLAVLNGVVGVAALLAPGVPRAAIGVLQRNKVLRWAVLFLLIVVGMLLFRFAEFTAQPRFMQVMGVASFLCGGVFLLLPTLVTILCESWAARGGLWYRFVGLVCLGLGYGFYEAAKVPAATMPPSAQVGGPTEQPEVNDADDAAAGLSSKDAERGVSE